jgi:hypothetical protein
MRLDTRDRDRAVELEEREGADRAGDVVEPEVPDLCSDPISDELDRSALSRRRTRMSAVVEGVTDVVRPGCRREDGSADRSRKERWRRQAAEVRPSSFHLLREGSHIRGSNSRAAGRPKANGGERLSITSLPYFGKVAGSSTPAFYSCPARGQLILVMWTVSGQPRSLHGVTSMVS